MSKDTTQPPMTVDQLILALTVVQKQGFGKAVVFMEVAGMDIGEFVKAEVIEVACSGRKCVLS